MPVYEYACSKCNHEFEVEQRISDDPVKTCPECRSRKVKRLISRTSFVLKGSGWYSDLYSSAKSDTKAESSDGEGKSDDKAAKPEKSDKPDKGKSETAKPDKGKSKDKGKTKASSKAA